MYKLSESKRRKKKAVLETRHCGLLASPRVGEVSEIERFVIRHGDAS